MKKLSMLLALALILSTFAPAAMAAKPSLSDSARSRLTGKTAPAETEAPTAEPSPAATDRPILRGVPQRKPSATATPAPTYAPVDYGDPLLNIAMEMAYGVHELAGDEKYRSIMYGLDDLLYLPAIAETNIYDLRTAYFVKTPMNLFMAAYQLAEGSVSPTAKKVFAASAADMPVTLWAGQKSQSALAEMTLSEWSRTYPAPDDFSNCAILLDCGGAVYWVSFAKTGDTTITAHAMPIFLDDGEDIHFFIDECNSFLPILIPEQIYPEQPQ